MDRIYELIYKGMSTTARAIERFYDKKIKNECSKAVDEIDKYGVTNNVMSRWENVKWNLEPIRDFFRNRGDRLDSKLLLIIAKESQEK